MWSCVRHGEVQYQKLSAISESFKNCKKTKSYAHSIGF